MAVLDPEPSNGFRMEESEVEIRTSRGSGPGGQHRNKTDSCVTARHTPSGVSVRVDMRSQHQSKAMALRILAAKLAEAEGSLARSGRDAKRRSQVGSGMRGDKVRTYREQDDRVTDHRTGKTWRLRDWIKGIWDQ